MTERMKTWIKGFAGGVAVTVIVGGIGYFICFGSVPVIGEQGLGLSDLGKASKIAKLVDTYYLDYKEGDEDSQDTPSAEAPKIRNSPVRHPRITPYTSCPRLVIGVVT